MGRSEGGNPAESETPETPAAGQGRARQILSSGAAEPTPRAGEEQGKGVQVGGREDGDSLPRARAEVERDRDSTTTKAQKRTKDKNNERQRTRRAKHKKGTFLIGLDNRVPDNSCTKC